MNNFKFHAVVGIDKTPNGDAYRVLSVSLTQTGKMQYDWSYMRSIIPESKILESIKAGEKWLNVKAESGKIKGNGASLSRFVNNKNRPFVILSQITNGKRTIGYRVANYDGNVTTIPLKRMVEHGFKMTAINGVPVQNAIFVPSEDRKVSHYKSYPNQNFIEELFVQKSNTNKVQTRVAEKTNEKNITKLEDIFTKQQIAEIRAGQKSGVNVRIYANPALSAEQMHELRKGLESKLDVRCLANPQFKVDVMKYYIADLATGLNIKEYLNPNYSLAQLSEVSTAYELGLDISELSNPKLSAREMAEISTRLSLNTWKTHKVNSDKSWK